MATWIWSETPEQRMDWCAGFDAGQSGEVVEEDDGRLTYPIEEPTAHYKIGYRQGVANRRECNQEFDQ